MVVLSRGFANLRTPTPGDVAGLRTSVDGYFDSVEDPEGSGELRLRVRVSARNIPRT